MQNVCYVRLVSVDAENTREPPVGLQPWKRTLMHYHWKQRIACMRQLSIYRMHAYMSELSRNMFVEPVRVSSPCDLGYYGWSQKRSTWATRWWNVCDPMFISYDTITACVDWHGTSLAAERDNKNRTLINRKNTDSYVWQLNRYSKVMILIVLICSCFFF